MRPLLLASMLLAACLAPDSLVRSALDDPPPSAADDDAVDDLPGLGDDLAAGAACDEPALPSVDTDPPPASETDVAPDPDADTDLPPEPDSPADSDGSGDSDPSDTDVSPDTDPPDDSGGSAGTDVPPDTDVPLPDLDLDGVPDADDCAPTGASVFPGAIDVCGDAVDQDCVPGSCGLDGITRADQAAVRIQGPWLEGRLGTALASVDVDLDGHRDLLVGAPCAPDVLVCEGRVAVIRSQSLVDGVHDVVDVADAFLGGSGVLALGTTLTVVPGLPTPGLWVGAPLGPMPSNPGGTVHRLQLPLPAGPTTLDAAGVRWSRGEDVSWMPTTTAGLRLPLGDEVLVLSELHWSPSSGRVGFLWARRAVNDPVLLAGVPANHPAPPATWWGWTGRVVEQVAAGRDVIAPHGEDWVAVTRVAGQTRGWRVHVHGQVPEVGVGEGSNLLVDAIFEVPGAADSVRAALVPDLTGDGADDLVVGAACRTACPTGGTVWVVPGPLAAGEHLLDEYGLLLPGVRMQGRGAATRFGEALLGEADLDDDGWADLVVGVPGHDADRGGVAVFHGPIPDGQWTLADLGGALRGAAILGEGPGDAFGSVLSLGDDMDRDGSDELVVGAPRAPGVGGEHLGGRVYVFRPNNP